MTSVLAISSSLDDDEDDKMKLLPAVDVVEVELSDDDD